MAYREDIKCKCFPYFFQKKELYIIGCKLLSFDTSTNSTGYSLYISGKLDKYEAFNYSSIKNTENRIKEMILNLYQIIEKINPDIVVVELTVVTRNAQTQRNLTMILGAIYGLCISKDIFFYSFRPSEWRKQVCVNGENTPRKREELKKWSIKKVEQLYGITNINDDISDAILIGKAYINKFSD